MKTRIFIKVDSSETETGAKFEYKASFEYQFKLAAGDYVMFEDKKYVVVMVEHTFSTQYVSLGHDLSSQNVSQDIFLTPWQNQ